MRRVTLITILIIFVNYQPSEAQQLDSASAKRIITDPIVEAINKLDRASKDTTENASTNMKQVGFDYKRIKETAIIFSPIALFSLVLFATIFKLRKEGVNLHDLLMDKDAVVDLKKEEANLAVANAKFVEAKANIIKTNPQAFANANLSLESLDPPTTSTQEHSDPEKKEQSTSRLVAFISGITSVALAVCITSFYFYRSFLGDSNVSIGNLATVLYGLGLGVLPYGFNKIAGALK